jgi:putative cofactor-binding repeat protein
MAATYDGLAIALLLWAILLVKWWFGFDSGPKLSPALAIFAIIALVFLSVGCFAEGGRYVEFQVEELVASVAAERSRTTGEHRGQDSDENKALEPTDARKELAEKDEAETEHLTKASNQS